MFPPFPAVKCWDVEGGWHRPIEKMNIRKTLATFTFKVYIQIERKTKRDDEKKKKSRGGNDDASIWMANEDSRYVFFCIFSGRGTSPEECFFFPITFPEKSQPSIIQLGIFSMNYISPFNVSKRSLENNSRSRVCVYTPSNNNRLYGRKMGKKDSYRNIVKLLGGGRSSRTPARPYHLLFIVLLAYISCYSFVRPWNTMIWARLPHPLWYVVPLLFFFSSRLFILLWCAIVWASMQMKQLGSFQIKAVPPQQIPNISHNKKIAGGLC